MSHPYNGRGRSPIILLISMILTCPVLASGPDAPESSLPPLFTSPLFTMAMEKSSTYRSILSDNELARLRARRSEIEARDLSGELQARESLLTSSISIGEQEEEFFLDLLNGAFGAARTVLEEQLAELRLSISMQQFHQAELQFESGQIPRTGLMEAEAAARTAQMNAESARWNRQDAAQDFYQLTGIRWKEELLPSASMAEELPPMDADLWTGRDAAVLRAGVRLEQKTLQKALLSANAPIFSYRLAEAEKEQALLALNRAEASSRRRFEQLRRRISHEGENLALRDHEILLYRELVETARRNYGEGLITLAAFEQTRVQLLQAQIRALETVKSYLSAATSYLLGIREMRDPEP
jgi:outer membrane protein TolC